MLMPSSKLLYWKGIWCKRIPLSFWLRVKTSNSNKFRFAQAEAAWFSSTSDMEINIVWILNFKWDLKEMWPTRIGNMNPQFGFCLHLNKEVIREYNKSSSQENRTDGIMSYAFPWCYNLHNEVFSSGQQTKTLKIDDELHKLTSNYAGISPNEFALHYVQRQSI